MHPRSTVRTDDLRLKALIEMVKAGRREGFSELYDLTVASLIKSATGLLHSHEDTEEVVCDVYLYVWSHSASYDPARGPVIAWLLCMTKHRAIDSYRRRARAPASDDPSYWRSCERVAEDAGVDEILMQMQANGVLHRALRSLRLRRRRLIGLSFFRGLSHQAIADATGLPLGSIKSDVRRALNTLKAVMANSAE